VIKQVNWRKAEEQLMVALMRVSLAAAVVALLAILATITYRGLAGMSWEMISQPPQGGFYIGKGGGVLNAIAGSLLLATGATLLAALAAVPLVLLLHAYQPGNAVVAGVRLALDVMWGIPSIVYGAFGFALMIALGLRASLLAGIITLAFVVLPILARSLDEVLTLSPRELRSSTLALGATRLELAGILLRQALPGFVTALLLAFGRGLGDAAAVLFTAGFTDATSLGRPVASLPLAVFFQLSTPFPAVQARAYAAALILTVLVLSVSIVAHLAMRRLSRHVIR
jgi:phosphate transport system permease protein